MKRYLLALALGFAFCASAHAENSVGPSNLIMCNKTASAAPASATTTAVISGVAGQQINICGWEVTSAQSTPTTFQFEYGTQGGPCSSPTTLTPALNITSNAPSVDRQQYASISLPAGAQLCVVTTGATVNQALVVWYATTP